MEEKINSKPKNIIMHPHKVSRLEREKIKKQKGCVLWFTGLSGSGKSTIANEVEYRLNRLNYHTYLLDGDNIRHGLNKDLGFSEKDRSENIRRIAEVSKLFVDAGLIVLTAFISPFIKDREQAKDIIEKERFIEIFVDTPFEECVKRDPKGLYKKALNGEIKNFTGLDSPYEAPDNPDIHIKTLEENINESIEKVINYLKEKGFLNV
jgi:adenylyl-sulfate kinase